jgi:hypothetical protein
LQIPEEASASEINTPVVLNNYSGKTRQSLAMTGFAARLVQLIHPKPPAGSQHRTKSLNPERRSFYELCWHLGGSQTDIANLKAEDIDWPNQTIAYARQKPGSLAMIHFGPDIEAILRRLNSTGYLFP